MKLNEKVCCIIVLFNPDIRELKKNLLQLKKSNIYTIFVDNFSDNKDEIKLLDLNTIFLEKNFGIAVAHNIGLKKAIEYNYEFAVLYDQDSEVKEEFFLNLYESFFYIKNTIDCNIAAIGPSHLDRDSGGYYEVRSIDLQLINPINSAERFIKTQYIISSGSMISLKEILKIGFMSEKYFIDYVDSEWGFRAYDCGYSIYVDKDVYIRHSIGRECIINGKLKRVHAPIRKYYMVRNSIYLLKARYIPLRYSIYQVFFQIKHAIYLFIFMKETRFKYLNFTLKGIVDGFKELLRMK